MIHLIFGLDFETTLLWVIPAFPIGIVLLALCWILLFREKPEKKISNNFSSDSLAQYHELLASRTSKEPGEFEQEELLMELPDETSDTFQAARILLEDRYSDFRAFLLDYINLSEDAFFEKYTAIYEELAPSEEKEARRKKRNFYGRYEGETLDRIVCDLLSNWIEATTKWRSFPICLNWRCESAEILDTVRPMMKEVYGKDLVLFGMNAKEKIDLPNSEIFKALDQQLRSLGFAFIFAADYADDYYFGLFPTEMVKALNGLKLPSMILKDSETFFNTP